MRHPAEVLPPATLHVPGKPGIALLHGGVGELVLFLHGVGGNKFNWAREVRTFARHFQAAAWDMRGYGESEDYEGPLRFEDLSDDILRVLAHLGAPRVHLVGLSMGGRIGFDFLQRHPDRVSTLTVCSASHRASEMAPERRAAFLASRLRPLRDEGKSPADIAPDVARSLVGPSAPAEVYEHLVASMRMLRASSYIKALEAVSLYDGAALLEQIAETQKAVYPTRDAARHALQ